MGSTRPPTDDALPSGLPPERTRPSRIVCGVGRARAKVNLYLEIVARRPDGYHELRTLFQTVDLSDDVHVEIDDTPGVRCIVEGADLPTDERNLAVRAAHEWLRATNSLDGVSLRLQKRIPVGAGLGGGSSDAAAVLRALQFFGRPSRALKPGALLELARSLGADVPFLMKGGFAAATGRGDLLVMLRRPPPVSYVLILPPFGTETANVYARAHERLRSAPSLGFAHAKEAVEAGVPALIRAAHHNDLAEGAMRAYPELLRFTSLTERLLGRPPCMTGSGSTLFDVPDRGEIEDVVARLAPLPGRRIVVEADSGSATVA